MKIDYNSDSFSQHFRLSQQSDSSEANFRRAELLGLKEKNVMVAPGAIVRLGKNGCVGENSFIGLYCYVNGDVQIGKNVLIGPHCSLPAGNHVFDIKTQSFKVSRSKPEKNIIIIGDGCWLAAGCTITGGVKVGKANLICANSVVTKDTPDYAIMAGTPAKKIGRIDGKTGDYIWD